MNRKLVLQSCAFLLILSFSTLAFATEMGIITGGPKGTYYQFGLNIQSLVAKHGINLDVYNSNGSVENVYAVYKRPKTQLGIVQSDVLAFISRTQNSPVLKHIAKKTRLVFPLYNEEIHLVGRNDITDFDDLSGRKVAIGKEGSGTYLTAKLLFEVSEITPAEMIAIGTDEALAQVKAGTIDAMFYVAGYPVKLFKEEVGADDGISLLPITNKSLIEYYPRSKIPQNTYSFLSEDVETIAVKASLVSFDFRHANCDHVGRVAKIIFENMDWLKKNGHPKWNFVDLDFSLKGWEQYDCVRRYLGKTKTLKRRKSSQINPVLDAIKDMF